MNTLIIINTLPLLCLFRRRIRNLHLMVCVTEFVHRFLLLNLHREDGSFDLRIDKTDGRNLSGKSVNYGPLYFTECGMREYMMMNGVHERARERERESRRTEK